MLDQFAQCDATRRLECDHFTTCANGNRWVVAARVTKNLQDRYGADVVVFTPKAFARLGAAFHESNGCPPGCPARRSVE